MRKLLVRDLSNFRIMTMPTDTSVASLGYPLDLDEFLESYNTYVSQEFLYIGVNYKNFRYICGNITSQRGTKYYFEQISLDTDPRFLLPNLGSRAIKISTYVYPGAVFFPVFDLKDNEFALEHS